jgi:hypothetical protein
MNLTVGVQRHEDARCIELKMAALREIVPCNLVHIYQHFRESYRFHREPGNSVSDYGLDDRAIDVRSPVEAKEFSSNLCVQTGSEGPSSLLYNGYLKYFPRG